MAREQETDADLPLDQDGAQERKAPEQAQELVSGRSPVRRAQLRRPCRNGWTMARRARFLEILRDTSNVTLAAEAAGLSFQSAYKLRSRDPGFARQWMEALEEGYAELEMLLLRQARFGSETVEVTDDGKGGPVRTKTTRSIPHAMAIRLLLAHRASVTQYRMSQNIARPGSEEVRATILERIAETRRRLQESRAAAQAAQAARAREQEAFQAAVRAARKLGGEDGDEGDDAPCPGEPCPGEDAA